MLCKPFAHFSGGHIFGELRMRPVRLRKVLTRCTTTQNRFQRWQGTHSRSYSAISLPHSFIAFGNQVVILGMSYSLVLINWISHILFFSATNSSGTRNMNKLWSLVQVCLVVTSMFCWWRSNFLLASQQNRLLVFTEKEDRCCLITWNYGIAIILFSDDKSWSFRSPCKY